ncbi:MULTISPECIES: efflux transporter outer membrane subunit [unclassified Burkholderia]|uniref:efflux transporter outer membrane subunit n=1 Tax=unclassified Burkholderia TaxID=2613784 RepID=UPI00141E640E|nr:MULTISPECIES: efflux transporter outer membrane subunit [unclassified Burkholderia]NIE57230.1 efflux transporter outer membrane subunit [Burkholderia sp. Ap-955]NIF14001.1 efflux transporter outer membrane subunit [Burkholderia sp. Ax-1735]NIG07209.1 efflux transporter outer membrane subunit [Burkholderia sp. Tr-849]
MKRAAAVLAASMLAACSIAPQPLAPVPVGHDGFRHADPSTDTSTDARTPSLAAWPAWFGDPQLGTLVDAALAHNLDIRAAAARVDQAQALLGVRDAALAPTVRVDPSFSRTRVSGTVDNALPKRTMHNWSVPVAASYEVDLWGRLRGDADIGEQNVLQATADRDAVRLRVATEVAVDYLTLRYVDDDLVTLTRAIGLRRTALDVIAARVRAGAASDLDGLRASADLDTAHADLAESRRLRENLVDAIAVLTGVSPTAFDVDARAVPVQVPDVPAGLPSALLAQRPDVFAAARRADAASLELGIARTAWLPTLTLTADGGFATRDLRTFLDRNSSLWSLGANVALTLFDGGKREAMVAAARAGTDVADANYRAIAIGALRDVQDALNDIAAQKERIVRYDNAARATDAAARLSLSRYAHGYVSYLEVIDADRDALNARRQLIHSRQALAVATVSLVRALGGGWTPPARAGRDGWRDATHADAR